MSTIMGRGWDRPTFSRISHEVDLIATGCGLVLAVVNNDRYAPIGITDVDVIIVPPHEYYDRETLESAAGKHDEYPGVYELDPVALSNVQFRLAIKLSQNEQSPTGLWTCLKQLEESGVTFGGGEGINNFLKWCQEKGLVAYHLMGK